ncbi:TLD-domain-containing protein [Endogone sp. FLAS-F59071]|nr:TLD-domain-containing protein [Endogone sp. FLAS-F59071]|eukprot:RUS19914.1 TLD-domain-containing protein [Endogone sp. FLAS-F59071]
MGQHQSSLPRPPQNPSLLPSRPVAPPHVPLPVDRHRVHSLFTRFELRAARQAFAAIKTIYNDGFECIEEKAFVNYLALPPHLTPASLLLFKSLSYLGSHPNSSIVGPVPLSFEALLTTLAILCRKSKDLSGQDADRFIFDSFAVVHDTPPTVPPASPMLVAVELTNSEGGPVPIAIADAMGDEIEWRGVVSKEIKKTKETKEQRTSRGFTLADLGISFEDSDDDSDGGLLSSKVDAATRRGSGGMNDEDDEGGLKMLARDFIELMTAFLWMIKVDSSSRGIGDGGGGDGGGGSNSGDAVEETERRLRRIESPEWVENERRLARDIAKAVSQLDDRLHSGLPPNAMVEQFAEFDELTVSLSWRAFSAWKLRNTPNLFLTLQSFIYTRFLAGSPAALPLVSSSPITPPSPSFLASRSLSASVEPALLANLIPSVDVTNILESVHIALLIWCLPAHVIRQNHWERLYSGSVDGFSMNRFERHVFKYPGPTLLLLQVEARGGERSGEYSSPVAESPGFFSGSTPTRRISSHGSPYISAARDNNTQTMILGAYIAEPWHPSRHAWGNSDHFLFEFSPTFELFPATSRNQQYVYYHPSFGIGLGGWDPLGVPHSSSPSTPVTTSSSPTSSRAPRLSLAAPSTYLLTISNTLQTGTYVNEVFPPLPTVKPSAGRGDFAYAFDVVEVEVFGFGGEEAKAAQVKEWNFENKEATRRATVHVRKEGAAIDKDILKLAGIIDEERRQDR